MESISPETTLSDVDPGDETARRFRYQWTYAAILCCGLLDDTQGIVEIFCEHHEDVLLKRLNGLFVGVQVKTKSQDQPPWKCSDEAFRQSLVRFVYLERKFPGHFSSFKFLTNHTIFAGKSSQSPFVLLKAIREAGNADDLSTTLKRIVQRVASEAQCDLQTAFVALKKTQANHTLPKLQDVGVRLTSTLTGSWNEAAQCSYQAVERTANHLITECANASSRFHEDATPGYLAANPDTEQAELNACIAGKRISKERLLEILKTGLDATATLDSDPASLPSLGGGTSDLLLKKLDAGGFSALSRTAASDLRDKAEYLGLMWNAKYGREQGMQRYSHIRSVILADASRSYEETKSETSKFGVRMRSEFERRVRARQADHYELYDCSEEHLEGFAYLLTSQCFVQWSTDKPWEDQE